MTEVKCIRGMETQKNLSFKLKHQTHLISSQTSVLQLQCMIEISKRQTKFHLEKKTNYIETIIAPCQ